MKWLPLLVSGMKNILADCKKNISYRSLSEDENPQIVYPLAFLYTYTSDENPYFESDQILEVFQNLLKVYFKNGSNAASGSRRHMCPFVQAYQLMKGKLGSIENDFKELIDGFAERFMKDVINRERLTKFTSANVGYGTNHLAVEFSGICAYEKYMDSKSLAEKFDIPELNNYLKDYFSKLMGYMHPDGYWSECDGPATGYNCLTAGALHKSAVFLDIVEDYRDQFEIAAEFYSYAYFPNLKTNLLLDGRMIKGSAGQYLSTLCFSTATRPIFDACMSEKSTQLSFGVALDGERLNILTNDVLLGEALSSDCSEGFYSASDERHQFSEDFGFIRKKGWMITCNNLKFMPRPEGHFNLDFQNLFSIYNDHFGCVVNSGHSKNDPELSTFSKLFMSFDGYPLETPMPKFIPHGGEFAFEDNGIKLFRDYRGFEGLLSFEIKSKNILELTIEANARLDEYPIDFNFVLPLKYGDILKGDKKEIKLGEEAFEITSKELGEFILLEPEKFPNKFNQSIPEKINLILPSSAELSWGFKRYDTYNLKTDRHEDIKDSICICKIPVDMKPVKVIFHLNDS